MEYNKLIAGMHTGDDVEGFYVLKDAFLKTTARGQAVFIRRAGRPLRHDRPEGLGLLRPRRREPGRHRPGS
ncbi:MAG: hypothetical protein V8S99_00310 [Oscillospiraceae bacterium]